jgi:hypothetical protein
LALWKSKLHGGKRKCAVGNAVYRMEDDIVSLEIAIADRKLKLHGGNSKIRRIDPGDYDEASGASSK